MKNHTFAVLVALGLGLATPAMADTFKITLDTSPLTGTQMLAFGLVDGDGSVNNTLSLTDFNLNGGSAVAGTADCSGAAGCFGDIDGGIALSDAAFLTFFSQQFEPGASLSFILNTTNSFAGGTPDAFAMYVCNDSFSVCYSDDAATSAMLMVDLTSGVLAASDFTTFGSSGYQLDAPVVTAAPEPDTLVLLAAGLTGAALRRRRRAEGPSESLG